MGGRRFDSDHLLSLKGESEPPEPDETDPLIGALLGRRYRVLRRIGEGTQATIYVARHTLIKRQVTIKVLHAPLAANRDLVRRFLDEAQIVGTMGHPNIVESLDMGVTEDERPYIVLEYLEGDTLTVDLAKGVFSAERAAYIAQQIASALEAVHERGIVHRDLKPENVLLITENARVDIVKLIDFGISKMDFTALDPSEQGLFLGTPEFVAPEQVTDPASVDSRADIYALGVMIYEMLCGRTPFEGEPYPEILESVVKKAPRPLGERRPGLPKDLLAIVDRCLQKDREDRFQRMSDLEEALKPLAKEPPLETKSSRIEARKPTGTEVVDATGSTPPTSQGKPSRDLRVGKLALVAACVVLLAFISYRWRKEPPSETRKAEPVATAAPPAPTTATAIATSPPAPIASPEPAATPTPTPTPAATPTAKATPATQRARPRPTPSGATIPTTENPGLTIPPDPPRPTVVTPEDAPPRPEGM